jgi:aspartate racemase
VRAAGLCRVGLPGTAFTTEQPFLTDRLAAHGLAVLVPEAGERAEGTGVIYAELCRGVVRPESREASRGVIRRLVERGAEGVILGCTEIELLIGADDVDVPVFPARRRHVDAVVAAVLDGDPG